MLDYERSGSECIASDWKSKAIYTTKLAPLHNLVPTIKYFDRRIVLQFNNFVLTVVFVLLLFLVRLFIAAME